MKLSRLICFIITALLSTHSLAQTNKSTAGYFNAQYTKTLYDITEENNPSAIGTGFYLLFNRNKQFNPIADITADFFIGGKKVLLVRNDGTIVKDVGTMVNLFGGISYNATEQLFISLAAGPGITRSGISAGVKPSVGYFLNSNKGIAAKLSYVKLFNREEKSNDFNGLSISLGFKLF